MSKPSTPSVWASGKSFGFQPSTSQQAQGFDYIASVRPGTGAPITDDHDWPLNNITTAVKWIMDQLPDGGLKYGCPLVGALVPWPLQQMPQEIWPDCGMVFIPYIGQAFDGVRYPLLKQMHPSGVLPADMRGEFPRGFDSGRGVDSGRVLMSQQESTLLTQYIGKFAPNGDGHRIENQDSTQRTDPSFTRFQSTGTQYGDGVSVFRIRPRNIAWNMIVRAA